MKGGHDSTLSPALIVSFAIPALAVEQELSLALQLTRQDGESILDDVCGMLQDAILDLRSARYLDAEVDSESTSQKIEVLRGRASQSLKEWHRRLKLAEDDSVKAEVAKQQLTDMRSAYFKELSHLREQLHQKEIAEANGDDFQFVDLKLFDPALYTVSDEAKQILQQKVEMIRKECDARHQEVYSNYVRRKTELADKLSTQQLLLERKEQLLQGLMQKHGYSSEIALEHALNRQETCQENNLNGVFPSTTGRSQHKKWTFLPKSVSKSWNSTSLQGGNESEPHYESRLARISSTIAGTPKALMRKVERTLTRHKTKSVRACAGCGKPCESGGGLCLDCLGIPSISKSISSKSISSKSILPAEDDKSEGVGACAECMLPPENDVLSAAKAAVAALQTTHRKLTSEQSAQSDIGGDVISIALREYFKNHAEAEWNSLLHGVSDATPQQEDRKWRSIGVQTSAEAAKPVKEHASLKSDQQVLERRVADPSPSTSSTTTPPEVLERRVADPSPSTSSTTTAPEGNESDMFESNGCETYTSLDSSEHFPSTTTEILHMDCMPSITKQSKASLKHVANPHEQGGGTPRKRVSSTGIPQKPAGRLVSMAAGSMARAHEAQPLVIKAPLPSDASPTAAKIGNFVKAKSTPTNKQNPRKTL